MLAVGMKGATFGAFVVRRLLWAAFLLVAASMVTYVFFWLVPADPAGPRAGTGSATVDANGMLRHYLHLDKPIWEQYLLFMRGMLHGSLGQSLATRQPVAAMIGHDAPITFSLLLGAAVMWLAISIPAGAYAALRPRSVFDRGVSLFVFAGLSAPAMFLGLVLSYVFGYRLRLTPIQGYCDFTVGNPAATCDGPVHWAYHLLLPWATFMFLFAAMYLRMVRVSVIDAMSEEYVRTARAKGASERRVVMNHVLRNALTPIVTMIGLDAGTAIFAATITEKTFGLPGLGLQSVKAYQANDEPVIIGLVMLCVICVVTLNVIVDLAYAFLDPRVRLA
jgi:peptide/nickel transport system permease protein